MAFLLGQVQPRRGLSALLPDAVQEPAIPTNMNMGNLRPLTLPAATLPQATSPLLQQRSKDEQELAKFTAPKPAATGVLGRVERVASTVGNVLGDVFAPTATSLIPGSDLYRERRAGIARENLARDSDRLSENAQRGQTEALTEFTKQRPQIMQAQMLSGLAKSIVPKGFKAPTFDEQGNLMLEEDPTSAAYKDRENLRHYRDLIANKAQVMADIAANKYKPGTEEYKELQTRLQHLKNEEAIALGNLGARRQEDAAHLYGTDLQGNALPGSLLLDDGTPVGTLNAPNVRPTTEQRNAAGRADIVQQLGRHLASEMDDPEIKPYLGAGAGRIAEIEARGGILPEKVARFRNDLISYGAFQAGFHPVRGIGALEYFDKVLGGLGQDPENLRGKLLSNEDTAGMVQKTGTPRVSKGKPKAPANVIVVNPEDM